MFGLGKIQQLTLTLGAALCCACPSAGAGDTDSSTTGSSTTEASTTSTTGASTTGEPTTADSSTSLSPTTGETGSTGEPPVTCEAGECSVRCTQEVPLVQDNGQVCTCTESVAPPEDWQSCELQQLCGGSYLCAVQALRWGVVGHVRWYGFEMDDGSRASDLDILGGGVARGSVSTGQEFACCDGSTQHLDVWHYPFTVPAPTDFYWDSCFTAQALATARHGGFSSPLPHCLNPEKVARACTDAPLDACPAPPPPPDPDAPCAETCPMAGDGVCDEPKGTGLCADGCDPIDCTCETDVPDQCDEVTAGGACPIGSDPLGCTCEDDFPGYCDDLDSGGLCPIGSDFDCR